MKEGRIENHRPVFSKGYRDVGKARRFQQVLVYKIRIAIVEFKVPVLWWFHCVNDQSTAVGVQICLVRGQPYVDIDGRLIGVEVDSSVIRIVCLESNIFGNNKNTNYK